jgi:predicted ATPase
MQMSIEVGRQLLDLARSGGDEEQLLHAWRALGATYYQMGDFTRAREQYSQAIHLYNPRRHVPQTYNYGMNAGVVCLSVAAPTWWMLGYPEQALAYSDRALALAEDLSEPASTGFALNYAASFHQFRGDRARSRGCAQASIDLCRKYGYEQLLASAIVLNGWAAAAQGEAEEGIAQIEQGLQRWRATGAEVFTPYFSFLLADANTRAGNTEKALALLDQALTAMLEREERRGEPELQKPATSRPCRLPACSRRSRWSCG